MQKKVKISKKVLQKIKVDISNNKENKVEKVKDLEEDLKQKTSEKSKFEDFVDFFSTPVIIEHIKEDKPVESIERDLADVPVNVSEDRKPESVVKYANVVSDYATGIGGGDSDYKMVEDDDFVLKAGGRGSQDINQPRSESIGLWQQHMGEGRHRTDEEEVYVTSAKRQQYETGSPFSQNDKKRRVG